MQRYTRNEPLNWNLCWQSRLQRTTIQTPTQSHPAAPVSGVASNPDVAFDKKNSNGTCEWQVVLELTVNYVEAVKI